MLLQRYLMPPMYPQYSVLLAISRGTYSLIALGSGGFGETWSVQDVSKEATRGTTYALKLFYARKHDKKQTPFHLIAGTPEASEHAVEIASAAAECNYAKAINKKWDSLAQSQDELESKISRSSQVSGFMKCYTFNQEPNTPMYILLSIAGQMELMQYL